MCKICTFNEELDALISELLESSDDEGGRRHGGSPPGRAGGIDRNRDRVTNVFEVGSVSQIGV